MPLTKPLGPAIARPLASDISSKVAYPCSRWWYTSLCKLVDILYKVLLLLWAQKLLFLVLYLG